MTKTKSSKGQTTMYKTLRCLVHLYLQLFVRGRMSYLRYLCCLCLFTYSGVHRILCCVLCTLCCLFVSIAIFWFPLQYSLTLIYIENYRSSNTKPTKKGGGGELICYLCHYACQRYFFFKPDCKLLCPHSPESSRSLSVPKNIA